MRILVIEDDREVAEYIEKGLQEAGFAVDLAFDGIQGLYLATEETFDVIVLDRMLPKIEGLSLLRTLRENKISTPVIILSAMGETEQKIEGLRAGSDDYMSKPFSITELVTRIQVWLKRTSTQQNVNETTLQVGSLKMDLLKRTVQRENQKIELKPQEFKLLEYLMRNAGHVVTRTMILEHVWDCNFDPQTNVVDVHMSRLRSKIDSGFDVKLFHTIRGAGYSIGEG